MHPQPSGRCFGETYLLIRLVDVIPKLAGVKWPETCMNSPLQVRRVGCVVYKICGFAKAKTGVAFAQLFDRGYS